VEEHLAHLFRSAATLLRLSASIVAGCGIAALLAVINDTGVAEIAGVLAASAAIIGTLVTLDQRRKVLRTYERNMEARGAELIHAIEQQLNQAIDLFYGKAAAAFQPLTAFCVAQRRASEPLLRQAEELERAFVGLSSRLC